MSLNNKVLLSIVFPVYNEEQSLPFLFDAIIAFTTSLNDTDCEIIFVDDCSTDNTPAILRQACENNNSFHYLRLSKNSGSHIAIIAGMQYCKGNCAVFMASDLQDPLQLIIKMLEKWKEGYNNVWAVREQIEGISISNKIFSRLFYFLINKFAEIKLPPTGADFALLDRKVINALLKSTGTNPSLSGLIASLGFKSSEIMYIKEKRQHGKSKWTLSKKVKAFMDAFVQFSFAPMRLMIYMGFTFAGLGFLYALFIIMLRIFSNTPILGWASIMIVVLVVSGVQMIMIGVLGEYLWRNLEESRKKPLYFIEESSDNDTHGK